MPSIQSALWGESTKIEPARKAKRAPRVPAGDEVRWSSTSARRDCDHCWREQQQETAAGGRVPIRRSAKVLRTSASGREYLCEMHARNAGWSGRASSGRKR